MILHLFMALEVSGSIRRRRRDGVLDAAWTGKDRAELRQSRSLQGTTRMEGVHA
jgi:hypothetical protein